MKRDRCQCRSGYTQIEMAVAVTLSASLMVMTVRLIHKAMFLSSSTRQHESQMQSMRQFTEDFRHQVQHSKSVTQSDDQKWLLLLDTNETVVYQVNDRLVQSAHQRGAQVIRRERMRLVEPFAAAIVKLESPPRLQLSLHRTDVPPGASETFENRVTAVVGSRCVSRETQP